MQKNPYKTEKRNLLNPFNALYLDDSLVSESNVIQEIIEYALDLDDKISGDFDLGYMIFEFFNNQYAYVRNGLMLAKIKFLKLYKDFGDGTFFTFCKEFLHKQRWQINDTIKAARVAMELIYAGFEILPANISQAASLAQMSGEELIEAWQKVIDNIPPDQITTKSIRNLLFPPTEKDKAQVNLKVPATLHEEVHQEAAEQGWSIVDLIWAMLKFFRNGGNSHLFVDEQKEKKWQEDLADLVVEGGTPSRRTRE